MEPKPTIEWTADDRGRWRPTTDHERLQWCIEDLDLCIINPYYSDRDSNLTNWRLYIEYSQDHTYTLAINKTLDELKVIAEREIFEHYIYR